MRRDEHDDPMLVRLERIPAEGLDLDETVTSEWLTDALGEGSPFKARGEGRLRVHLLRAEDVVHVRGRAALQLGSECSRCLEPVSLAIDTPIEVALFPLGSEPAARPDGEVARDDLGVATYRNDEIDLGGIVHDEVFLELPMNPLCSESCAGLCPTCGTNLNEQRCDCEPAPDPRWSALRQLKLD
jgi:uncharacterized protein